MTMTARGRSRDATNAAIESEGTNVPSSPCCATSASVRAVVRLWRATVWPCRARLRARLRPMTASPLTPMFAVARSLMTSTVVADFSLRVFGVSLELTGALHGFGDPTEPRKSRMATELYADIKTAIAHSRHVARAPLRWDPVGHLLSRFGFGPTPGTRAAVAKNGYEWWLTNQTYLGAHQGGYRAHKGVQAVGPQLTLSPYDARQWLASKGNEYGWTIMDQLTQVTVGLQTWSPAQLYESLVDFFSNHLNVPNHSGDMWNTRACYDREVIRPWAMRDFTNMLLAAAKHPAMLI